MEKKKKEKMKKKKFLHIGLAKMTLKNGAIPAFSKPLG